MFFGEISMFIISTYPLNSAEIWFNHWYVITDCQLYREQFMAAIFDGLLYDYSEKEIHSLFKFEKPLDGEYIYCQITSCNKLQFYTSPTGNQTIYYYHKNDTLIITDDLPMLLKNIRPKICDMNKETVKDFYALSYPIGEETFINNIYRFPQGQAMTFEANNNTLDFKKCFHIKLEPSAIKTTNEIIDEMEQLFLNSIKVCLNHYGENKKYCIALSNGLDSRLVAYYFHKYAANLFAYFFGEQHSAEGNHAAMIANIIDIPLFYGDEYSDFYRMIHEYAIQRPFSNVEWSKYRVAKKNIPEYDIILSGYMGNHLYGGWEYSGSNKEKDNDELSKELLKKFIRVDNISMQEKLRLIERIKKLLNQNNENILSRKWEFYFRSAIAYERDCEFFQDVNNKKHFSLFCNINLIRHSFTYKTADYQFRRLYMEYLKQKTPMIHPSRVPAIQVINSHKPLEKWVCGNEGFLKIFCNEKELIEFIAYDVCEANINIRELIEKVRSGSATRNNLHILFQFLTIAELINNYF